MVLVAKTRCGLQDLITRLEEGLSGRGLHLNTKKCATVDMDTVPRDRQIVVNANTQFTFQSGYLPAMSATSWYKYLGVETVTRGTRLTCIQRREKKLESPKRVPLRPQQRLWVLKTFVIPGLYHQLVLTRTIKSTLQGLDRIIRRTVRSLLRWPKDAPKLMFHAGEDDGGLGVPQLRVTIPMLREARITRPMSSDDPVVLAMTRTWHFKTVLREMERARPAIGGVTPSNKMESITPQADALHATQDGKGLSNTRKCAGHSVLTNGTLLMTGSTSIDVTKIRGNLISTKGRINPEMAQWTGRIL